MYSTSGRAFQDYYCGAPEACSFLAYYRIFVSEKTKVLGPKNMTWVCVWWGGGGGLITILRWINPKEGAKILW